MFYTIFEKVIREVSLEQVANQKICVGSLTLEELQTNYPVLGLTEYAVTECINNINWFHNTIEVYEDFSFGMVSVVDMVVLSSMREQIGFLIRKDLLVIIRLNQEYDNIDQMIKDALGRIYQNVTMEKMVSSVLERLLFRGNQEIISTESLIIAMEQQLAKGEIDESLSTELFELRNRVSTLKTFYDQMIDIGESFQENENELFEGDELRYLKNFITKAERMNSRCQVLNDNLIHLWELMDATMNYNLNNTMKVFTIATIIFQPMTMIAGWYGMNFANMPELNWKYGYLYVIALNILTIGGIIFFFKQKKYL